jgi:hypothetical protein
MLGCTPGTRSSVHPPALTMLALEAVAIGLMWANEAAIRRWIARPRVNALQARLNEAPITILAWHQPVALAFAVVASVVLPELAIPGLTSAPTGPAWILARLVWIPVAAVALGGVWRAGRLLESPATRDRSLRAAASTSF